MKKPVVDYRNFRFSKLNSSEFSHLKYLLSWIIYLTAFVLTEAFIPYQKCFVMHCGLDDIIPFCEWFIIPYVFWYLLIFITSVYFLLYNPQSFKNFMKFIIITQVVAMAIYVFFPNRQDLRPLEFQSENLLTKMVLCIYYLDTSTNVCPSLHVAYSLAMASVWLKEKGVSIIFKTFILISIILICLSTVFLKQHSVLDGVIAFIICLVCEIIVYKDFYFYKREKTFG